MSANSYLIPGETFSTGARSDRSQLFFAGRHLDKLKSPLDSFLDDYLRQANNWPDLVLNEIESLFNKTIELVYAVFGESAFLAAFKNRESSPSRKIVCDYLMQAFSINLKAKQKPHHTKCGNHQRNKIFKRAIVAFKKDK
jgi:hypothetical protein